VASAGLGNSTTMTVGLATIAAGHTNPLHRHPNCDEVLHLLSGKIRHTLGNNEFLLSPGDTISIPMGEWHNATVLGTKKPKWLFAFPALIAKRSLHNKHRIALFFLRFINRIIFGFRPGDNSCPFSPLGVKRFEVRHNIRLLVD